MAIRDLELAALVLDFVEQAHVRDRDDRLVGEGREQADFLLGECARRGAAHRHRADRSVLGQHRHDNDGAVADELRDLARFQ